jgi:hypothetical protein
MIWDVALSDRAQLLASDADLAFIPVLSTDILVSQPKASIFRASVLTLEHVARTNHGRYAGLTRPSA